MPFDIFGEAMLDYLSENYDSNIITYSSLDEKDVLPVPYLFRDFKQMPKIEQKALEYCKGKVLDIGCGAGSHSLWLQENGHDTTALDSSAGAIEVCKKRGVHTTVHGNILDFSLQKFDTLLLLMNGIGIVGKLNMLEEYLGHFKSLIHNNGQVLVDSSDIIYMFDSDEDGGHWVPGDIDYYGEVSFQMEYKGQKGPIFDWLYVDFDTLKTYAEQCGFKTELIVMGDHYDYLAKLTLD